jgi:murein DD-endopeptidase MepM/ murein hydrolase activator NlpD
MKRKALAVAAVAALLLAAGILLHVTPSDLPPPGSTVSGNRAASREIDGTVRRGETVAGWFQKYRLRIDDLLPMRRAAAKVHALKDIPAGKPYRIMLDPDNNVLSLSYHVSDEEQLRVVRSENGFVAEKVPIDFDRRVAELGGVIRSSLYAALPDDDGTGKLSLDLSDIFSWDVDFNTDLRKGDTFRVIVEELRLDGRFRGYGNILAAELVVDGTTYRAYRFGNGRSSDYFDGDGNSLRRAFLKAPLSYRRITSRFTKRRFHPILKIVRPHLGVDYAAPTGTPVSATGDGVVTFAGYRGPNGNLVRVRHGRGYTTSYGHLSRIARGIRAGARVRQGDVVGYVGATGLATGPHLDYRMKRNGVPVDPLKVAPPRGRGVASSEKAEFLALRDRMREALAAIAIPHDAYASAEPAPRSR